MLSCILHYSITKETGVNGMIPTRSGLWEGLFKGCRYIVGHNLNGVLEAIYKHWSSLLSTIYIKWDIAHIGAEGPPLMKMLKIGGLLLIHGPSTHWPLVLLFIINRLKMNLIFSLLKQQEIF